MMNPAVLEARPDPELQAGNTGLDLDVAGAGRVRRGRLRIFLGAAAGVGKTYAMLEAARQLTTAGAQAVSVVAGFIEAHGRPEITRLLEGVEQLPAQRLMHRGVLRQELDLDGALARRPGVLLVDDLAHVNPAGGVPPLRHARRWQDIQELLTAGIEVWTTVNVQHLESLSELVHQITGLRPLDTIPDRLLEEADDIELVDLPPDDLIERLRAGKVHIPDSTATLRLFRPQNLLLLRENALRRVADRVSAASRALTTGAAGSAPAAENRVLVAVGPDDQAGQLVRAGKRIADALRASWTVAHVETPRLLHLQEDARHRRLEEVLRLAEALGGESVTLGGSSAATTLVEYARTRKATRLIVGAPKRRGWRTWLRPSTATQVVERAAGFDVIMIGEPEPGGSLRAPLSGAEAAALLQSRWRRYVGAAAVSGLCTFLALGAFPRLDLANVVMIYQAGATIVGLWLGRGPSVCIALLNALVFFFCFVPPRYSFGIGSVQYLITVGVMLCTALVIATLTDNVRGQTRIAGARERRTALLYAMSRELAASRGQDDMARVAVRHVAEVFQCQAVVLLPDARGKLRLPRQRPLGVSFQQPDLAVAQWVAEHSKRAGLGCDDLPAARGLYIPLGDSPLGSSPLGNSPLGSGTPAVGVLAVLPSQPRRVLPPEQSHLLATFAAQIALALERARLAEAAEASSLAAERESLRNTLLASISHDLRTPLSVIAGAASTLSQQGGRIEETVRVDLARSIETKAREMAELVSNVLDLMRWQSGQNDLRRDWQTADDLIGTALRQLENKLGGRDVELRLPAELPPIYVDAQLVVQLFVNLLDNVAKYTPEGSPVTIGAATDGDFVRFTVEDEGPGLPDGDTERLFEKFQRGSGEGPVTGVGLGLAICHAIVRAHGGQISAYNRASGGACFDLTLPARELA